MLVLYSCNMQYGDSVSVESIVQLVKLNCLSANLYYLESEILNKYDLNNMIFSQSWAFVKIFFRTYLSGVNIRWINFP